MFLHKLINHSKILGVIMEPDGYNAIIVIYDLSGKVVDLSYVNLEDGVQTSLKEDLWK